MRDSEPARSNQTRGLDSVIFCMAAKQAALSPLSLSHALCWTGQLKIESSVVTTPCRLMSRHCVLPSFSSDSRHVAPLLRGPLPRPLALLCHTAGSQGCPAYRGHQADPVPTCRAVCRIGWGWQWPPVVGRAAGLPSFAESPSSPRAALRDTLAKMVLLRGLFLRLETFDGWPRQAAAA